MSCLMLLLLLDIINDDSDCVAVFEIRLLFGFFLIQERAGQNKIESKGLILGRFPWSPIRKSEIVVGRSVYTVYK